MAIDSTLRGIRLSINQARDAGEKPEVVFGLTDASDQSWTLARIVAGEEGSFGGRLALEVNAGNGAPQDGTIERMAIDSAGNVGIGGNLAVQGALQAGAIADVASEITALQGHGHSAVDVGALPISGGTVSGNLTVDGTLKAGAIGDVASEIAALKGHTHTAAEVGALSGGGGTLTGDLAVQGKLGVKGAIDVGEILVKGKPLSTSPWSTATGGINYKGGNVGIASTSPKERLDVNGRTKSGKLTIGPWPANPNRYVFFGTNSLDQAKAGNYALLQDASGANVGRTFLNSPVDIRLRIGNSDKMVVAKNGFVGIGTSAPKAPLHVANYMAVGPFAPTTGAGGIDLTGRVAELGFVRRNLTAWPAKPQAGDRYVWYNHDGKFAWLWTNTHGNLFGVSSVGDVWYRAQLNKLDVDNNFTANVRCADFRIGHSTRRKALGRALVDLTTHLSINHAGDWKKGCVYGVSMNRRSSRALKNDIEAISPGEAHQVLDHLSPVKYTLKSDPDRETQLGFIAEDVPEQVGTADRNAVNNDHIVAVLVRVVQQQQKALATLSGQRAVDTLQRRLERMEELVRELKPSGDAVGRG